MSNGGYKGASPARETSPEQYPGVWELTEQFQAQADGNWPFQADDCAPKSLRFDGSSAYLSRTLTASSNRRVWTMSMWVKRSKLGVLQDLFGAGQEATNDGKYARFQFMADDTFRLRFWTEGGSLDANLQTSRVFRDCSAFYHFVIRHDSTETNQEDRLRIYVNGELITSYSSPDYLSQNVEGHWNFANKTQMIGAHYDGGGSDTDSYFGGFISEVHHIDGQSLPPEEFAFEDGQGIWQPKRFTGDYSSGPVYSNALTASNGYHGSYPAALAFDGSTTTRAGNNQSSGGGTLTLTKNITVANQIRVLTGIQNTVKINGTSIGTATGSDPAYVVSNAAYDITEIVIEAPNSNGYRADLFAIEVDGVLLTDASVGRNSFHLDFSDTSSNAALGNDSSGVGNDWTPNNLVASAGGSVAVNSITFSGNNNAGNSMRAFYIGSTAVTSAVYATATNNISQYDSGQNSASFPNAHDGDEGTNLDWKVGSIAYTFTGQSAAYVEWIGGFSSGGSVTINGTTYNAPFTQTGTSSGNRAIYRINLAPTAEQVDSFVDSPVNGNEASTGAGGERRGNYATLNPLAFSSLTLVDGNLQTSGGGNAWLSAFSTIKTPESGKWFYECTPLGGNNGIIGIFKDLPQTNTYIGDQKESYGWYGATGNTSEGPNNTQVSYNSGATFTANDVIGVALDLDAGTLTFYKNGTSQGVAFSGLSGSFYFAVSRYNGDMQVNFGQRAFSHPVSGFSPLATSFLPEPTIKRGDEVMDVVLWTGNNSTNKIGNLRLSPDLVWIKARSPYALNHELYDTVRGAGNLLRSNSAGLEASATRFSSFDSDGFTLNGSQPVNGLNETHVGWVWDAGDSTSTIAAGGLNSSAYASGRTWSSDLSATSLANQDKMFDWTYGYGSYTGTCTWTTTNAAYSSLSGRVYLANNTTLTLGITFKGSNGTTLGTFSLPWTGDGQQMQDTGFDWSSSVASVEITGDYLPVRVQIGNQTLVDTGTTVTNVPLVATDVRARTDAGFSISKWSKSANNQSYAHGLSQAPEFIIAKSLDGAHSWRVWHKDFANNKNILLDTNNEGETTYTDMIGIPDAYKVPLIAGGPGATNGGMIAYNYHSVEGYCKVGSWSTDSAPFVFTGFRPKFLFYRYSSHAGNWAMFDTERDTNNPIGPYLFANSDAVEASQDNFDFLSNGFKLQANLPTGRTVVYICFAEHPFASNCRAR